VTKPRGEGRRGRRGVVAAGARSEVARSFVRAHARGFNKEKNIAARVFRNLGLRLSSTGSTWPTNLS
jgi:hypothetical protein